jgi:hypothetical protein
LTDAVAEDINRAMRVPAPRLWKAAAAAVLIAAFASAQPVMMANMSAAHRHAGHATHGSHTPGQHAPPLQCCDLCPVACAATPGLSGAAPRVIALERLHPARPVVEREPRLPRARLYELPFPLGPPTLRVA